MVITATELKANLGLYLKRLRQEDIVVTKNGKKIARIIWEEEDLSDITKSLFGILPTEVTLEEARRERPRRYV